MILFAGLTWSGANSSIASLISSISASIGCFSSDSKISRRASNQSRSLFFARPRRKVMALGVKCARGAVFVLIEPETIGDRRAKTSNRAVRLYGGARYPLPMASVVSVEPDDFDAMLAVAIREAEAGVAEGGIPIGAAIFAADGRLISSGHNRRVQENDPSIH